MSASAPPNSRPKASASTASRSKFAASTGIRPTLTSATPWAAARKSATRKFSSTSCDCNLVRTSHYPQSPWFLDHCDRIGLLVFEEIPGWQHIGDAAWKRAAIENVRAMIERDWNHPSIVIWGVRINEFRRRP